MQRGNAIPFVHLVFAAVLVVCSCAKQGARNDESTSKDCSSSFGAVTEIASADGVATVAMTWTGTDFALVWSDDRNGSSELYFTRVVADGTKLLDDIAITSSSGAGQYDVGVLFAADTLAVSWATPSDSCVSWLSIDGVKTREDTCLAEASLLPGLPGVAWSGERYGIAWYRSATDTDPGGYFVEVGADGALLGTPQQLSGWYPTAVYWFDGRWYVAALDGSLELVPIASGTTEVGASVALPQIRGAYMSAIDAGDRIGLGFLRTPEESPAPWPVMFTVVGLDGRVISGPTEVSGTGVDAGMLRSRRMAIALGRGGFWMAWDPWGSAEKTALARFGGDGSLESLWTNWPGDDGYAPALAAADEVVGLAWKKSWGLHFMAITDSCLDPSM